MSRPRDNILAALRGGVLPERVPAEGLLIVRDGEPGGARGDAITTSLPPSALGSGRSAECRAIAAQRTDDRFPKLAAAAMPRQGQAAYRPSCQSL